MKMNIKTVAYLLLLLSCGLPTFSKNILLREKTTVDNSITVFVHETFPARKALQYSFGRFLIYCPQGLSLAKNLPTYYHFYKLAHGCVERDPQQYSLDQFYLFGWESEHVYDSARIQAASDLTKQLYNLVHDYYHKHHVIPKVRLMGYSHGGNVVLHTANYLPLTICNEQVDVEVWIFGTPIQNSNKYLVNSPHFSKVYSFYSKKDWIQRMDPQGLSSSKIDMKNFWSDRMFDRSDRCIQVDFTVNGKSISHVYYRSIFKYFPIIQRIAQAKSQGIHSGCIAVDLKK